MGSVMAGTYFSWCCAVRKTESQVGIVDLASHRSTLTERAAWPGDRRLEEEQILHNDSFLSVIDELRNGLNGHIITPDDPGYDNARMVFSGGIDRRPAVITRPADA